MRVKTEMIDLLPPTSGCYISNQHSQIFTEESLQKSLNSVKKISLITKKDHRTPFSYTIINDPYDEQINQIISGKSYYMKAMQYRYMRICNQKNSLKCQISCSTEFQVMTSQTNPFPTNNNCDQMISNRGFIIPYSLTEWTYLAFIARKDTEVKFYLSGDAEIIKNHNIESKRIKTLPDEITSFQLFKGNKYQEELFRQERFLKVLSTRNFHREANIQAKRQLYFKQQQKEIATKERIIIQLIEKKKVIKQFFQQEWTILLFIIGLTDCIKEAFFRKKEIIKRNLMAAFRFKMQLKRKRKKIENLTGQQIETRVLVESYQCLITKCQIVKYQVRKTQIQLIYPILKKRAEIYFFKQTIVSFSQKISIIKKYVNQFWENYQNYRNFMIQKWDYYNDKLRDIEIKEKPQALRNKAYVAWFHYLKEKEFAQQMRQCFIQELMRDRIRAHIEEQKVIKKRQNDLKYYKQKIRLSRDHTEIENWRIEVFHLSNEIYAMHMKNQLFMRIDVARYFDRLIERYIVLIDEPNNLPLTIEKDVHKTKQRQSKLSLRKGIRQTNL